MKKVVLIALSVLCVMLLLGGCGGSNKLVGVWEEVDGDGILYFAEDNTGLSAKVSYTSASFDYKAKEEKLTFIAESTVETDYTIDENILTITVEDTEYRYKLLELSEGEIDKYLEDHGIEIKPEEEKEKHSNSSEITSDDFPSIDDTPSKGNTPEGGLSDREIAESIVGAWRGGDDSLTMVYVFYEDGTGIAGLLPFTYSVKDGVISMTIEAFGEVASGSGRYDISGDCLSVEGEDGVTVFQRTEMPDIPELPK